MRKTVLLTGLMAAMAMTLAGCKGRNDAQTSSQTNTIPPAVAQPAPTGTDALTQTVDIEDSRSEAEGAGVNEPQNTNTAAAVKRKTGAAASSRKTPASQSRPPGSTQ